MAKSDMVEKRRFIIDQEEFDGIINVDEIPIVTGQVDVPGIDKIVPVSNGVVTIPAFGVIFKIRRDDPKLKFINNWFKNKETHDVVMIRSDSAGNDIERIMMPNVELLGNGFPAYDASAPVFAQNSLTMAPEDIIRVAA